MAEKRSNGTAVAAADNGHGRAKAKQVKPAAADMVNLNTASPEAMRQLRGVGPALAERIVQYRATVGAFAAPEELMRVPGISEAIFEANKHWLIAQADDADAGLEPTPPTLAQPEAAEPTAEADAVEDQDLLRAAERHQLRRTVAGAIDGVG